MSKRELRAAIRRLQQELESVPTLDPASRERLRALTQALDAAAETEPSPADVHHMTTSIRQAVGEFEVSHPRATGILNDIMVMLSNMGI